MEKRINKILLVNPPGTIFVQPDGTKQVKDCPPPLGLAYLAAQFSGKYDIQVYDMAIEGFGNEKRISDNTILFGDDFLKLDKLLADYNPDLVGASCILSNRSRAVLEICNRVKKVNREIITVVGGHHASALPSHILQGNADFVLAGEADHSFLDLIHRLNNREDISGVSGLAYRKSGQIVVQPKTDFVEDLDSLPFPAWDIVGLEKYWGKIPMGIPLMDEKYAVVNASRGCPHICKYCAVPTHTGIKNFRPRSINLIRSELEFLVNKYGIGEVQFTDDNFFVGRNRIKEICKMLSSNFRGMHFAVPTGTDLGTLDCDIIDHLQEAGFHYILLGIETGDLDIQGRFVDKRIDLDKTRRLVEYLKQAKIKASGGFMMGFPGETREQVQRTIDLATSLDLDKVYFIMVTPLPGSQLYDFCMEKGLLYPDFNVEEIRYSSTFIANPNIPRQELEELRRSEWKKYMKKQGQDIQAYDNRGWTGFKT
jgi:magnesium-protoporphyrin IX monomethyl ester (oxidative) cyclase